MKRLLLLSILSIAASLDVAAMSRQPANSRASEKALPLIATPEGSYIAGGEQAQNGLWNGKTMETALSNSKVAAPEAELIVATSFGEDVAPDQPIVDTEALKAKNDLGDVIKTLTSSKSPAATGALVAAQAAFDQMKNWSEPTPQGDRKGAQQVVVMRGTSADVRAYGISHNESIAAIRAKTTPRANAAQTTTRTEEVEWTEPALDIVGKWASNIASNYWAFTLADKALDEKEIAEQPGDPTTPDPVPVDDKGHVAAADRNGSQVFLWKPVSDSNGNLVVILPAKFNNLIDGPVKVNGTPGSFSAVANGNRSHWRFDKPGSAFGTNVAVTWTATGKTYTVTVPNGFARYETSNVANPVTPTVPTPASELPKAEVPAGQGESPAP